MSYPTTQALTASPHPLMDFTNARTASRLVLIDRLRGLMIVLMVLDHVREFFHDQALLFQPTDIDRTTIILFVTRWVTHLCAPTFVFLSGVSIWLQRDHGKTGWTLSRFLLTRGLWLVVLELTVVALALDFAFPFIFLQVIWAIGMGMLLMAALVHLPRRVVLAIGVAILAGYQAAAMLAPADKGDFQTLWTLLVQPGLLPAVAGFVAYPVLPWFAFMAIGYGIGDLFIAPPPRRDRTLFRLGAGLLIAFALLRLSNLYGDFRPWSVQDDIRRTILSFLNVSKYPPSLSFGLATLGVSMLLAPLASRLGGGPGRLLDAIGRTPLFTYLIHLYLIHGAALLVGLALGFEPAIFLGFLSDNARLVAAGWGVSLAWVYVIWILVLLILWPIASWYGEVKARGGHPWLSYL